jgi:hypothetical protein
LKWKKVMFGFSCSMKFSHVLIHVKSDVSKTPPLLVSPSFAFSSFWKETLCVSEKFLLHFEKEHDLEDYKMCVKMTLGIQKVVNLKMVTKVEESKKFHSKIGSIRQEKFMRQTKENTYKHCSQHIWKSWIPTWFVGVTIFGNWKK